MKTGEVGLGSACLRAQRVAASFFMESLSKILRGSTNQGKKDRVRVPEEIIQN